jgi:hypothetical protein
MKQILITVAVLFALLSLAASTAQAQRDLICKINVPFEFSAGGNHLPPGQYLVFHVFTPNLIQLQRVDGRAAAHFQIMESVTETRDDTCRFTFNKYGEHVFLAQIQKGDDGHIHHCFKCRAEQTLAAQSRPPAPLTIEDRPSK